VLGQGREEGVRERVELGLGYPIVATVEEPG